MATCNECGRDLKTGEQELCPACLSTKAHKTKRWTEIVGGVAMVVFAIVAAALSGGKNGGGGGSA